MYFVQENSRNSIKEIFLKFQRFLWGFLVCFGTDAFDLDTFQRAI